MIFFKNFFLYTLILITLSSCQSIRENLSMQKKVSVDEFLIETKNPLVVPPDFSELPQPKEKSANEVDDLNKEKDLDLSKVLSEPDLEMDKSFSNEIEKKISNILNKK